MYSQNQGTVPQELQTTAKNMKFHPVQVKTIRKRDISDIVLEAINLITPRSDYDNVFIALGNTLFLTCHGFSRVHSTARPSLSRELCVVEISILCLSVCKDVCRNSGEIILKASGSFFKRRGGQTLFCIVHA